MPAKRVMREKTRQELETALAEARSANESLERKAAAALRVKADFMARMSHEMRTPLNAVIGLANLFAKTDLNARQADYLEKIRASSMALLGIVDDIMDYSRLEGKTVVMASDPFLLQDVMTGLHGRFASEAAAKGVDLILSIDADTPSSLVGDRPRLEQLLGHLTSNAVKFTDAGSVTVRASLVDTADGLAVIRFSVGDTGRGMERERIPGLFESFTQAEGYITRRHGGTGLGLAICRHLARAMRAEIKVESEPGEGSIFSVDIPFAAQEAETVSVNPPEGFRDRKALVVDDDPVSSALVLEFLEGFSFTAHQAASGKAALNMLAEADDGEPYDLVVMDWMMPGMDGMATARAIRRSEAVSNKPALIMMSSFSREDVVRRAEREGAAAFLLKPINQSLLFDAVSDVFTKAAQGGAASSAEAPTAAGTNPLSGKRILLVEDNAVNRQVAVETLEHWELAVTVAENGEQALAVLAGESFDAVLMDVQMPVMDGLEATRRIRLDQGLSGLPVIALTAHAAKEDREACLEAGMDDYVSKPIDADTLYAALHHWLAPENDAPGDSAPTGPQKAPSPPPPKPSKAGEAETMIFPDAVPGLDLKQALKRLGGNSALLESILREFVALCGDARTEITESLDAGDAETVSRSAHTIKGVAGNVSASALAEAAADMETAARENDFSGMQAALPDFQRELETALASLAELLDAHASSPGRVSPRGAPRASSPAAPRTRAELRVLLVDDARINRNIFTKLLTNRGHDVHAVANGMEACSALFGGGAPGEPFDLVLMDIEMPVMDGFKAAGTIRDLLRSSAKPPCRPDIPIIALTSHSPEDMLARCLEAGMNACVHKSYDGDLLHQAVEKAFQESIAPAGPFETAKAGGTPYKAGTGDEKEVASETTKASAAGEAARPVREEAGPEVETLAAELAEHLKKGALQAEDDLAALQRALAGSPSQTALVEVEKALTGFDFKKAHTALTAALKQLGVPLKEQP